MDEKLKEFTGLFTELMKRSAKLDDLDQLNTYPKNASPISPGDMFSRINKQIVHNETLANIINIFEIIEGNYDTIVRFYSIKIYIFSYKNYGTSFLITADMKKDLYKKIINAFTTNEDVLRMHKDDLNSLYSIKDTYFDVKSSEDAFTLGKELLKNIFDKTRDKILVK